ncbi:hypothetical protein MFLAVUS_006709 [Mucor flavus]|uniref:Uncharacterized protein n=1 Tax=Mucor flavus TaxID=439312 RepID=A0ABP9Z2A1_9FUNG
MSCCNYTISLPIQEQHSYYQSGYWYYPQQHMQYNQPMFYPNSNNATTEFELPMSNNNVLQDDNFSIVTASDLYQASPSSIPPHLSPYSTPSPLLSDTYHTTHSEYYSMVNLFGPVEHSTSKVITAATEKKHICPVCSHR